MTLEELKTEISERIESEQDKLDSLNNSLNNRKSRKDRNDYISWGMLLAYGIVADYLDDLEVILDE